MKQIYKHKDGITAGQLIEFLSKTDLNAIVEFEQSVIKQVQFSVIKNKVNLGRDPYQISEDNNSESIQLVNTFNDHTENLNSWFVRAMHNNHQYVSTGEITTEFEIQTKNNWKELFD